MPFNPQRLMAVPRTPRVWLEITKAVRALAIVEEDERLRKRRAETEAISRNLEQVIRSLHQACHDCAMLAHLMIKYSPDEPRVPKGNPDGGQWTGEDDLRLPGGGNERSDPPVFGASKPLRYAAIEPAVVSDAANMPIGLQYAGGPEDDEDDEDDEVRAGGRPLEGSPAEQARRQAAELDWNSGFSEVHKLDPLWKPSLNPSLIDPDSIEGEIGKLEANTKEANEYLSRLYDLVMARHPLTCELVSPLDKETGIPYIDFTTEKLMDILDDVILKVGPRRGVSPQRYGILVHQELAKAVRAAHLPGIDPEDVEKSIGADGKDARYGEQGSIRLDVPLRDDQRKIVVIYDFKTGAGFRETQIIKYRQRTGSDVYMPIFELHPGHRVFWKRHRDRRGQGLSSDVIIGRGSASPLIFSVRSRSNPVQPISALESC